MNANEQYPKTMQAVEEPAPNAESIGYHYTIRTDAALCEVTAVDMDHAAEQFARDEFPGENITTVDDLFAKIRGIGDGAWCWIESDDAPDGLRRGGMSTDRCY